MLPPLPCALRMRHFNFAGSATFQLGVDNTPRRSSPLLARVSARAHSDHDGACGLQPRGQALNEVAPRLGLLHFPEVLRNLFGRTGSWAMRCRFRESSTPHDVRPSPGPSHSARAARTLAAKALRVGKA